MIKNFRHKGLERFFATGNKKGIRPAHADRIERMLDVLHAAKVPEQANIPGFRFHELQRNREGTYSLTVTGNWRITFQFDGTHITDVDLEDYH